MVTVVERNLHAMESHSKAVLSQFKYVVLIEDAISGEDDRNYEKKYCVHERYLTSLPENLSYTGQHSLPQSLNCTRKL